MKSFLFLLVTGLFTINTFSQVLHTQIQWQKSLGGKLGDAAASIQKTTDGGYIMAGCSSSNDGDVSGNHGGIDYWVVKLNSTGAIIWQKTLGGTGDDSATSIQQTIDGGYIVAGTTNSYDGDVSGNHGGADYWIVKLNPNGDIVWQKALGGTDGGDSGSSELPGDYATSIQQTADGGYIVAGQTSSNDGDVSGNHGDDDFWVVKLNSTGAIIWQKTLGGGGDDGATSIQQTTDGGYIVAGYTYSNDGDVSGAHGYSDYWIVKLNATGAIVWQKALGGIWVDGANSIQQTTDGGYIVAGSTDSNNGDVSGHHGLADPMYGNHDYWVVKLNAAGDMVWQKALGGTGNDSAQSIQQTADGGYIVAGYTNSNNGDVSGIHGFYDDYWIVKLNATGAIVWQKTLGGTAADSAQSIQQTTDGGYIVAGYTESDSGDASGLHGWRDSWVVKLAPESLSVSEFENNANNIIYPNPCSNAVTVQYKEYATDDFKYKIVDLAGRIVKNGNAKCNEQINVESLTSGNYIIQIQTENGDVTNEKLIKN